MDKQKAKGSGPIDFFELKMVDQSKDCLGYRDYAASLAHE